MAQLLLKQEDEAKKTLQATLKLSPQHERAKAALELLQPTPAAAAPASP